MTTPTGQSATREKVVIELLTTGRASAARLQALLLQGGPLGPGPDEARRLTVEIVGSFTKTLSVMGSTSGTRGKKGPTPPPTAKERRGCYKRRRTSDSRVVESPTQEDGFAWRKYGQKEIMNSNYPRCYFRCTHKYNEGCKALKQVQMIKDDPITYQTTYFNRHTCKLQLNQHHVMVDSIPTGPNLISFGPNDIQLEKYHHHSPISTIISQVDQETRNNRPAKSDDDQDLSSDEAKSTLQDPWQDINDGLESLGYKPNCDFGSLHGLDEEVNEFGDIDYSWYSD